MANVEGPEPTPAIQLAHRRLDSYFDETRDLLSGKAGSSACFQLRDALDAHFAQEESLYFPAVWKLCPDQRESLQRLITAHAEFLRQIDATLAFLETGEVERAEESFAVLQRGFAKHELSEESILESIRAA